MFRNLIDNAVRYADADVAIACSLVGSRAVVTVDDDGPGIPLGERQNVFERFARLDASRNRSTGGTGLGLAIAKSICEGHRGTIVVGDSPCGGARVKVTLPVAHVDGAIVSDRRSD